MNPIAIRLLSQQLICQQYSSPTDVVAHMGAMQAQDYRMVRWAVAMRTKRPSADAFRKAFDEGDIVRLHLLRGTWHPWQKSLATDTFMPVGNDVHVEKQWQNFRKMAEG